MKTKAQWEELINFGDGIATERMKVIGGWVLRTSEYASMDNGSGVLSCNTVFIPDLNHAWEIEK